MTKQPVFFPHKGLADWPLLFFLPCLTSLFLSLFLLWDCTPTPSKALAPVLPQRSVFWEPKILAWMGLDAQQGLAQSKDAQEKMNYLTLKRKQDTIDPLMAGRVGTWILGDTDRTLLFPVLSLQMLPPTGSQPKFSGDLTSWKALRIQAYYCLLLVWGASHKQLILGCKRYTSGTSVFYWSPWRLAMLTFTESSVCSRH